MIVKNLINSFTGRMLIGLALIHISVLSLLFYYVLGIIRADYQTQFINFATNQSYLIEQLLEFDLDEKRIKNLLDDMLIGNQLVYADYMTNDQKIITGTKDTTTHPLIVRANRGFDNPNGNIYYIITPQYDIKDHKTGVLRLGYDKTPILQKIATSTKLALNIAGIYSLLSLTLIGIFGTLLSRSIRRLRKISQRIANGHSHEKLALATSIVEVTNLAKDLEYMRVRLVETARSEAHEKAIIQSVAAAIVTINAKGLIESFNSSAESTFGYSSENMHNKPFKNLLSTEYQQQFDTILENPSMRVQQELIGLRQSGEKFPLLLSFSEAMVENDRFFTMILQDITKQREFVTDLEYLATHDALTGLANRSLLYRSLAEEINIARANQGLLAVMFLDLDRFKSVNDTLGHATGDLLVQKVAERLMTCIRKNDLVARIGGDEFALILTQLRNVADVTHIAEKILAHITTPYALEGHEIYVFGSIGISIFPSHDQTSENLLQKADIAMYHAKQNGGNRYVIYDLHAHRLNPARLTLESKLRRAVAANELNVLYQPKIDLQRGTIIGFEALCRWNDAELGPIAPSEFIPLAEETWLIEPIFEFVLKTACQMMAALQAKIQQPLSIAVNLSGRQIQNKNLPNTIAQTLQSTGLAASDLELEITESVIVQQSQAVNTTLQELKQLGLKISIDDFGTGYSSLSYLKHLPVDMLKIDRAFISSMSNQPKDRAIVTTIIEMAHQLNMHVLAEGVETKEQVHFLQELNCDQAQGFYFSEPIPQSQIEELLMRQYELPLISAVAKKPFATIDETNE